MAAGRAAMPSVIVFRLRDMRPASVTRPLQYVIDRHADLIEQGAIISVTESRIRVRHLPIR